jgi:hypothetical protein
LFIAIEERPAHKTFDPCQPIPVSEHPSFRKVEHSKDAEDFEHWQSANAA